MAITDVIDNTIISIDQPGVVGLRRKEEDIESSESIESSSSFHRASDVAKKNQYLDEDVRNNKPRFAKHSESV